ncbi:MAG TPA: DUF4397 domain-containing protein [Casimicrobiaceae bacterium]|nr:DUF4397 domain-containing protein [Casimicrobiaceae bacterium]
MNARRAFCVLLVCLSTILLGSCDTGEGVGAAAGPTRLRVINLIPDAATMSLTLGSGAPLVSGLPYQGLTQYLDVDSGTLEFKVSVDGGATTLIDINNTLATGLDYTYIVYGPVEAVHSTLVLDTTTLFPDGGTFDLRLINVATNVTAVDIYLTGPGADLSATAPTVRDAELGSVTPFTVVNTATYELRITRTGTKDVIFDTPIVNFPDKGIAQMIVYGTFSAQLVDAAVLNIDSQGTGQVYPNNLAEFKFVNASSVGAPLNVFVDGILTLANVSYAGVSSYQKTTAAEHSVSVQSSATPGAILLSLVTNFASASDSSIVVSGAAGSLQGLVLADNNMAAGFNRARIRFVNASPDLAAMDVYANFAKLFTGVTSISSTPYTELVADSLGNTSYEFDFNLAGTTNRVLQIPSTAIISGKTYSVYVVGPASALQGVVVADD